MIIFFLLLNNKMVRPRRLYKDSKGRYFYIVNNQQKFVKVPKDMAEKDVVKISLKTLENLINKRRVKRKKKRPDYKFEQPVVTGAPSVGTEPESSKLVVEGRKIPQIEDVVKNTKQKKAEQLSENVESFFNTLADRRPSLKSNATFIQAKRAKEKKEEEEQDAVKLRSLPTKLRQVAKDIIASAKDYKDVIKIINEEKFLEDPTKATGGFVTLASDQEKYKLTKEEKDQIYSVLTRTNIIGNNLLYAYSALTGDEYFVKEKKKGVKQEKEADKSPPPTSKKEPPAEKEPTATPAPTPPDEPKPPAKPAAEQIRNIKKAIRKPKDTSGLMPSLRTPAKTTDQKLAETPSFSATTPSGTTAPAAPLSTTTSTSPMPESIVEKIRKEIAEEEQARGLMGLGEEGDDALYNDEIAKIIEKRVGRVVPVIPSDKVKYLKDYVKRGQKNFAAVINTNPSQSDGTGQDGFQVGHWRAIFVDNRDDYPSIEYFDPLVSMPEKELVTELKKIAKKMNPERMFLYKENRLQRQAKEASTCGYHAAQFVDDRMNGESWCSATGYDDYINRMGGVDDSKDGEKEIRKTIKKYKVYL
jgi:hypothetical protein